MYIDSKEVYGEYRVMATNVRLIVMSKRRLYCINFQ